MNSDLLRPDRFAIGLFAVGVLLLFIPLMVIVGAISMLSAFGYWLTMIVVKRYYRRRT